MPRLPRVFGANVALVPRRSPRMAHYGANPRWCCLATTADPAAQAARLIGEPVEALDDGAPVGERTIALWSPACRPT